MKTTAHLNFVQFDKKASWPYPTWSNVLVPNAGQRAVALVCDRCAETEISRGVVPQYAIQIDQKTSDFAEGFTRIEYTGFKYWEAAKLPDAPPITPETVER